MKRKADLGALAKNHRACDKDGTCVCYFSFVSLVMLLKIIFKSQKEIPTILSLHQHMWEKHLIFVRNSSEGVGLLGLALWYLSALCNIYYVP